MSPVRAENRIVRAEMGADADGNGFLSDVGVTGTVNQATLMRPDQLLFASANEQHTAIQQEQLIQSWG
jgi:hypothetical protein